MNEKDCLKLVMCLYHYDEDIKIDCEEWDGDVIYNVEAKNSASGDEYYGTSYGLVDTLYDFLAYIESIDENGVGHYNSHSGKLCFDWVEYTVQDILSDEKRKEVVSQRRRAEKELKEYVDFFKEVDEEIQEMMPCKNGMCENGEYVKVHGVDKCMVYNSANCSKFEEWHKLANEMRDRRMKEWDEQEQQDNNIEE